MENRLDHRLSWLQEEIPNIFAGAVEQEFTLMEQGLDRHGTFEWTATRFMNQLNRYVVLGVTLLDEVSTSPPCNVDILVGADDGSTRFMRQPIRHRLFSRIEEMREEVGWYRESIDAAVSTVVLVEPYSLAESKPLPLGRRPFTS